MRGEFLRRDGPAPTRGRGAACCARLGAGANDNGRSKQRPYAEACLAPGAPGLYWTAHEGCAVLAPATLVGRLRTDRRLRRNLEGWGFASPWIVGFVLFTVGPMVVSAVMAFTKWDLLTPPSFVGLENFRKALSGDPLVWHSLKVTTRCARDTAVLIIVRAHHWAKTLGANSLRSKWIRSFTATTRGPR